MESAPRSGRIAWAVARMRSSHGFRSGVILAVATLVLQASGYLFNVACIRYLGSEKYGDVAAMLALVTVLALPLGSIQSLLAREVAQLPAPQAAGPLLRRSIAISGAFGIAALGVGLLLVEPIENNLHIESGLTVVAGLSGIVFAVVASILYGFLQGEQRFLALGVTYLASGMARPLLVVPALLSGMGAAGALGASTLAGVLAVALAVYALRDLLPARSEISAKLDRGQMAILLVGSLAFASLTNVDILLASYFLGDEEAGVYAAAALVGKFVLFLPTPVILVLLPKAASRTMAGITPHRILFASAAVTAVLTLTVAAALALVPESLLVWAFGGDFRDSTGLLGWFGLAMSAAALVNVYLSVYFAERDFRFPLLVLAAAAAQVAGVAFWHPEPLAIVLVTLVCSVGVLIVHELAFPHSLVRFWRSRRSGFSPP